MLLGDLVSQVAEDVVKLSQHHGAVGVFVVQLEELHIVVVCSLAVRSLDGSVALLYNLVKLAELLALLVSLAQTYTHLLGGVEAHGVHDVSKVEHVKLAFAIPVIDVTDLLAKASTILLLGEH